MIYSTCAGCGDPLIVTDNLNYHNNEPPCTPKLTKAQRLAIEFRDAVEAGDTEHANQLEAHINGLDNQPPRLLDAALTYATWGWPVFPLKTATKQPATRHGFKDATTNPHQIANWWKTHPTNNIGLPTGLRFDVIDFDPPAGSYTYTSLRHELPKIYGQVATASGGIHLYVKPSGQGNAAGIAQGLDYRGIGGYVVAPPSRLAHRYRAWSWITKPAPLLTRTKAR
ncbi:MAG: bifunctional DNA primase/polymerase [Mycobacteriaceae bacterium]|nr:bifunctional DNA primase/polymerase [Mycobacteriaceae bacterium]